MTTEERKRFLLLEASDERFVEELSPVEKDRFKAALEHFPASRHWNRMVRSMWVGGHVDMGWEGVKP